MCVHQQLIDIAHCSRPDAMTTAIEHVGAGSLKLFTRSLFEHTYSFFPVPLLPATERGGSGLINCPVVDATDQQLLTVCSFALIYFLCH
jgi:hypothetical protein